MPKTITALQNDTVDAICWREYGSVVLVLFELVLSANPKLAEFGPFIPMGTQVTLPEIETPQQTKQTINLWD